MGFQMRNGDHLLDLFFCLEGRRKFWVRTPLTWIDTSIFIVFFFLFSVLELFEIESVPGHIIIIIMASGNSLTPISNLQFLSLFPFTLSNQHLWINNFFSLSLSLAPFKYSADQFRNASIYFIFEFNPLFSSPRLLINSSSLNNFDTFGRRITHNKEEE